MLLISAANFAPRAISSAAFKSSSGVSSPPIRQMLLLASRSIQILRPSQSMVYIIQPFEHNVGVIIKRLTEFFFCEIHDSDVGREYPDRPAT